MVSDCHECCLQDMPTVGVTSLDSMYSLYAVKTSIHTICHAKLNIKENFCSIFTYLIEIFKSECAKKKYKKKERNMYFFLKSSISLFTKFGE